MAKVLHSMHLLWREFVEERSSGNAFVMLAVALVLARIAVLVAPASSPLGGLLWIATYFFSLALLVPALAAIGNATAVGRAPATLILGIAGAVAILAAIVVPRTLMDMEAMGETFALFDIHRSAKNFGFGAGCHIGYPCESLALAPLLNQWFGPSLSVIRGAFLLPVFVGWLFFVTGLVRRCRAAGDDAVSALILITLASVYFIPTWLYVPEQSVVPLGHALAMVGLALHYLESRERVYAAALLVFSVSASWIYTPALALVPLAILAAWLAFVEGELDLSTRKQLPYFTGLVAVAFTLALIFRSDIFRPYPPLPENIFLHRTLETLATVTESTGRIASLFAGIAIVATIGLGLLGFASKRVGQGIAAWTLLVIVAAVWMPGYSWMAARDHLHRGIVALPALLVLWTLIGRSFPEQRRWTARGALILALAAIFPHYRMFTHPWEMRGQAFGGWIENRLREYPEIRAVAMVDLDPELWPGLTVRRLKYTFPHIYSGQGQTFPNATAMKSIPSPLVVITSENKAKQLDPSIPKPDAIEQSVIRSFEGDTTVWILRWNQ